MIKRLWRSSRLFFLVLLVAGLLLRITGLRDSLDILAPVYYLTPWPALAVLCLWAALPFIQMRTRRWMVRISLLLLCLGVWLKPTFDSRILKGNPSDLTVLLWNLQQQQHVNHAMVDIINQERPDIAVFLERGDGFDRAVEEYRQVFPGYAIRGLENLMVIFCRGEILSHRNVDMKSRSRYNRIEVVVDKRHFIIYAVDIDPNAFLSRREPLDEVRKAASKETYPTIIAGDFNTPFESAHFDAYRESLRHAFSEAGSGMMETWPYFLPVLSLDHIWTDQRMKPVKTSKVLKGFSSDHAALVTSLVKVEKESKRKKAPEG